LKFFHESTHLGDEFVLDAQDLNDFRRYNVSYKALELYQALDGFPQANLYMRGYGGYRFIDKTEYEDFREFEQPPPLKGGKHEFQFGVEFVLGAASSGMINNAFSALRVGPVAHYVLAFDLYSRHQYAINNPKRVLGKNVVLGLIWGSYFQAHLGKHSIALLLNFYDGPNPHGQFRKEDLTYLGADISIGF
ncbi:MAG: DUF1207 domain-containing protein, partial [bacterium]|nr:DUF1207 domain-containing protein [bacterium]